MVKYHRLSTQTQHGDSARKQIYVDYLNEYIRKTLSGFISVLLAIFLYHTARFGLFFPYPA